MPQDLEQATERTKLLYHVADDRRLSAVQQEEDSQSVIASYVSKDEQALSSAPIGERLPYNDYTTIDWLHDLVRDANCVTEPQLTTHRSKTPTAIVQSMRKKAYAIEYCRLLTTFQAGLRPPSLASLRHALPSSWMWQKPP